MALQWEGGGGYRQITDRGPFGMNVYGDGAKQAISQPLATLMAQPGQFATAGADLYRSQTQGLGSLGNSYNNAYGAYAGGLGNFANAMANERGNFYAANAMAEAARQGAVGNLGVASLGAFGGAANSALSAWAQNQQAYNRALSDINNSNQMAMSQYGQSRNNALSQLGNAYSGLGGREIGAAALGNLDFNFGGDFGGGGGGFAATGPGGPIASGSYGGAGGGGGGGFGGRFSRSGSGIGDAGARAYGGMGGVRDSLMAGDITGSLDYNSRDAMNRVDAQHYSSRAMPSQMLGQTLSGLMQLGGQAYESSDRGMNQFYGVQTDPRNRADFSGPLDMLASGYRDVAGRISSAQRDLNAGYGQGQRALADLWSSSAGPLFSELTPMGAAQSARSVELFNRRNADENAAADLMRSVNNADVNEGYRRWAARRAAELSRQEVSSPLGFGSRLSLQ